MKLPVLLLFFFSIVGNKADSEFGRATSAQGALDIEEAMRELLFTYDMSMSLSMSMSYSYGNDDYQADGAGTGSSSPAFASEPTSAPGTFDTTSFPSSASPTAASTESLLSCYGLDYRNFTAPLFIETRQAAISFTELESALENLLRGELPLCGYLNRRKLEDLNATSNYYIGNVDLVRDVGATCQPKLTGNHCFVGELTLKLFGNATYADVEYILRVIDGLLQTNMDGALGVEDGLENDVGTNSTINDDDQHKHLQASRSSREMSAGRKAMISLLTIAVVAMAGAFAYRHFTRPKPNEDSDCEGSEDSLPHTMAATDDRDRV